jgi:hypothetical protein
MGVWRPWLAVVLVPVALAACGGTTTTVTQGGAEPATSTTETATTTASQKAPHSFAGINTAAQDAEPSTTSACNEVPMGHACRASTAAPEDPNQSPQRNCDPQIVANSATSCAFAENAFYETYKTGASGQKSFTVEVYSPTTHKDYELGCARSADQLIGCVSSPTSDGIYVAFSEAAITAYTETQANAYAATREVGSPSQPDASSQQTTSAEPSLPQSGEAPESAEDEAGSYSHASDESFCQEHECIGEFESEDGYVVECADGSYSHAGGKSGACSDHGGETGRE